MWDHLPIFNISTTYNLCQFLWALISKRGQLQISGWSHSKGRDLLFLYLIQFLKFLWVKANLYGVFFDHLPNVFFQLQPPTRGGGGCGADFPVSY